MRPGIRDKVFNILSEYCKYREKIEIRELVACSHKDNSQGCHSRPCPMLEEMEKYARLARLGSFFR
jgi:hypothetical protein